MNDSDTDDNLENYVTSEKRKTENRREHLFGANTLITTLERHTQNIGTYAETGSYGFIKDTAEEMLRLLSQLRGAVYMENP